MTEHKNDHVTMNVRICLAFSTSCGPIGKIFIEVARTYQSYKASVILAYSDARGALLVCTLLSAALNSYRDRINSLFFQNDIYLGLSTVEHISQSSGIYSRIPATLLITSNFFFRVSLWVL